MPSSISMSAIVTLKTSQTTRPGWLWVRREKKFDMRSNPHSVGHIDLDLRDDDKGAGESERDLGEEKTY